MNFYKRVKKISIGSLEYILLSLIIPAIYVVSAYKLHQGITIHELNIFWKQLDVISVMIWFLPLTSFILAVLTIKTRSVIGLIINIYTPVLLFMSVIVAQYKLLITVISYCVIFVGIVFYMIAMIAMIKYDKPKRRQRTKIYRAARNNLKFIVFFTLLIVIFPVYTYYDGREHSFEVVNEYYEDMDKQIKEFDDLKKSIPEYPNNFNKFSPNIWNNLKFEERYRLLKELFEYMCRSHNLDIIPFKIGKLDRADSVLGAFDDEKLEVYVDSNCVMTKTVETNIITILHEFRHYYQYSAIQIAREMDEKGIDYSKSPYFDDLVGWKDASDNYSNVKGYVDYYKNELEYDSRKYAEDEVKKFEKYYNDSVR